MVFLRSKLLEERALASLAPAKPRLLAFPGRLDPREAPRTTTDAHTRRCGSFFPSSYQVEPATMCLAPCGHRCLCGPDAAQMQAKGQLKHCPYCKQAVSAVVQVRDV